MRGGALSDFLRQRRKNPDFVAFDIPTQSVPSGREPIGRLCFRSPESPLPTTFEEFAQNIANDSYATFAFYVDTCFILQQEIPPAVWDVLFKHNIVITHDVWRELENWRNTPTVNRYIHSRLLNASLNGDPNIEFQSEATFPPDCAKIAHYYSVLLGLRKRAFSIAETYLREKLKREPTEAEIHQQVQKIVSDRGMALASKGKHAFDSGSKNVLTDERIVASAFVRAIAMGQESSILTYDDDLREQFFKLQYLLDTHYRSMLIAESFAEQPLNFYCVTTAVNKKLKRAYDSVELWSRPLGLEYRVLPESFSFVNVNLFRFGGTPDNVLVFPMCFSAEREMERLFNVKLQTCGANTDKLAGRNLHICPLPGTELSGGLVAISTDAYFLKSEPFSISVIDAEMALRRFEQSAIRKDVVIDEPTEVRSPNIDSAINYMSTPVLPRLRVVLARNPEKIGNGMFPFVLKMCPPHAEVVVDRTITTSSLPDDFRDAINIRRGWWVSKSPFVRRGDDEGQLVVDYYASVLAHKKLFSRVIEAQLASQLGELPTEGALLKELNLYDKGSGTYRASQFLRNSSDALSFEDDRVTAHNMIRAIGTGADTIFITQSKSTFEQFCTLSRLLILKYRAWCISHKFGEVDDPLLNFWELVNQQMGVRTKGDEATLLDAADHLILPKGGLRVRAHCWLLEHSETDGLSIFTAEANLERPMIHMLIAHNSNLESAESGKASSTTLPELKVRDSLVKMLTPKDFDMSSAVKIGSADFPCDERLQLRVSAVDTADLIFVHREGDLFQFPWRPNTQSPERV